MIFGWSVNRKYLQAKACRDIVVVHVKLFDCFKA